MIEPVRRFFIRVCIDPRLFPGVRCSVLNTEKRSPSCTITIPGRNCVALMLLIVSLCRPTRPPILFDVPQTPRRCRGGFTPPSALVSTNPAIYLAGGRSFSSGSYSRTRRALAPEELPFLPLILLCETISRFFANSRRRPAGATRGITEARRGFPPQREFQV